MSPTLSQEYVHAFIDGELADDEQQRALAQLESDPEFKAAVCEAQARKAWIKAAYGDPPTSPSRAIGIESVDWRVSLAAVILLAVGMGGGWLLRDFFTLESGIASIAGLPGEYRAVVAAGRVDPGKIVLHLDAGEPERLARALDVAESLLSRHGARARIEIVVNSYGLDLLRADLTPADQALGQRIVAMAKHHANLGFVACGQTVARLKREGVTVELLPVAHVASSAISEITTRMSQGWVYVKV